MDPNAAPLPQDPIEIVRDTIKNLQLELRAQGASKQIRDFDGQNSRKFREWLREVERAGSVVEADDERFRAFCLMSLKGPASDFLGRTLRQHPNIPWANLKAQLRDQFGDSGDGLLAKQKLLRTAQHRDETIQNFAERLFSLAEESYANDELANAIVQSQLVEIFTAGLREDSIARKLLRERPRELVAAVRIAVGEHQTARCFQLCRRTEEPMEVNSIAQTQSFSRLNEGLSALSERVEILAASMGSRQRVQPRAPQRVQPLMPPRGQIKKFRNEWTPDGRPICNLCKKPRHKVREGRVRQFPKPPHLN